MYRIGACLNHCITFLGTIGRSRNLVSTLADKLQAAKWQIAVKKPARGEENNFVSF